MPLFKKKEKLKKCPTVLRESKTWLVWGIKGGVGKSTVSALFSVASSGNKRTLLIDSDFRDGASRFILGPQARQLKGWYDVLVFGGELEQLIHRSPLGVEVLPPGTLQAAIEYSKIVAQNGIEEAAQLVAEKLIDLVADYEVIVIDTPAASFADIPIIKCTLDVVNGKSVLLVQGSIPEIERTLKVSYAVMGRYPDILAINQIHPKTIKDPLERELLKNEILKILALKVKVLAIPFMSVLYQRILWENELVKTLLSCISAIAWKTGNPAACEKISMGLIDKALAESLSSV